MNKATPSRFNIRVYALLIENEKILITREKISGRMITKFPGGGLELGESTINCIKREFIEELNLEVEVGSHFYTTDFFVPSAFDDSQVISIYYNVSGKFNNEIKVAEHENTVLDIAWISLKNLNAEQFTFPIDKHVVNLLKNTIQS